MRDAESLLGLDDLLSPVQREWRDRARTAAAVIAETIDEDVAEASERVTSAAGLTWATS